MGIHRGPNTVKDGLVFGYDTGYGLDNFKPARFYKGKPAVNMLNSGDNFGNWNKTRNSGSNPTVTSDIAPGPFENTLADKLSLPNDGSYPRLYQNFTPASTATHTFSVWLKAQSANQGVFVGAFRNSPWALPSSTSFNITDEWVNYTFAVNPLDTSSHQIYIGSHDSHKGKEFLIYGAQLETGSSRSTFVDGTRSATTSLIDLKRTTNIDVSNVSFDSTGQPIFDGTDDIIDLTLPQNFQDKLTIETWYKGTDSSRNHLWNFTGSGNLNCNFNDGSYTLWLYWDGGGGNYLRFTTPQFCDSEIHHIVFVHEGSTNKVYLDGVLLTNGVAGGTQTFNSKIGSTYDIGGSPYFQGDVYVNRVYAKALTASQVKQNYNAYKNRFDI